jgi:hypothetical protein
VVGFGLRKFAVFLTFTAALAAGSIAAHAAEYGRDGFQLFGFNADIIAPTSPNNFQVRVQQRVIVRVPRHRTTNASTMANGTPAKREITYKEEKIGNCLIMDRFIASRPGPGPKESLELVTRDGVFIRAYLGNGCLAREFYAGAYMERPADGKLCVDRDLMYARTGAKCEIDKFRALVPK